MAKAAEDEDLRAELAANPKATLSAKLGVEIPELFAVEAHEDSATTAHLVPPPTPALTEEELALAAGGWTEVPGSQWKYA